MTRFDHAEFEHFINHNMRKADRLVPARLQAALALLERLRTDPILTLEPHLTPSRQQVKAQERHAKSALERLNLPLVNTTSGRRSSNLHVWGPKLLDFMQSAGFAAADSATRDNLIDGAQGVIVPFVRQILEVDPIELRLDGRTIEASVSDLLEKASERGKLGEVAQYLVGAKLQLRFPSLSEEIRVAGAFERNRRSRGDNQARLGDFELSDCVFEIAAGRPDGPHLDQVKFALEQSTRQVWLLVRREHAEDWRQGLIGLGVDLRRVAVASIELFVGQNVLEMGECSRDGTRSQMEQLIAIYHEAWVRALGAKGIDIRIV